MNDTNSTTSKDTTPQPNEQPVTAKGGLNAAKDKARAVAEAIKTHDFKSDAHKVSEGVKNLKDELGKHDFKEELRAALVEAKKNPASLWKKPETQRPGKAIAIVSFAAAVILWLLLLVTSSSFIGLVCFLLGIGTLLFSVLGLKTEGRKLAVGGSVIGLLVVLCALGQMFGAHGEDKNIGNTSPDETSDTERGEYEIYEGKAEANAKIIIGLAKMAGSIGSLDFCGFYTGMSYTNANLLAAHYGMDEKDHLFKFNPLSGEVVRMCFSPRALDLMMQTSSDYDAAKAKLMDYLGITEWTVDAGDSGGYYYSPNGITVELSKSKWGLGHYSAVYVADEKREEEFNKVAPRFFTNKLVLEKQQELDYYEIRNHVFDLPDGVKLLMSFSNISEERWENSDRPLMASFELTETQWESITGIKIKNPHGFTYPVAFLECGSDEENDTVLWRFKSFQTMINSLSWIQKWNREFLVTPPIQVFNAVACCSGFDGSATPTISTPDGKESDFDSVAWLHDNSNGKPHPVAQKKPNITGLYDILGNMSEIALTKNEKEYEYHCFGGDYADKLNDCLVDSSVAKRRENDLFHPKKMTIRLLSTEVSPEEQSSRGVLLPGNVLLPMQEINGWTNRWIGSFEVTRAQWKAVMGDIPQGDQQKLATGLFAADAKRAGVKFDEHGLKPVTYVSWNDCQRFLEKLNALPSIKEAGITFDLPTADEWEYAAREGEDGVYGRRTITTDNLRQYAWYDDERPIDSINIGHKAALEMVQEIGWREPNYFNLFDMLGNVAEWTSSDLGGKKIVCGGNGNKVSTAPECEISFRQSFDPGSSGKFLGLRLVARVNLPVDKAD